MEIAIVGKQLQFQSMKWSNMFSQLCNFSNFINQHIYGW